jgi:hypothetical protein
MTSVQRRGEAGAGKVKKLSRALVAALLVVVALAGFNVTIPAGRPVASNWRFVLTHPSLLLHVLVATLTLIMAAVALIMSIRSRDRPWIATSTAGLGFVLLAFLTGDEYVMSLHKSALDYMSLGWAGAVIVYGTGWYLGRKRERQMARANARES